MAEVEGVRVSLIRGGEEVVAIEELEQQRLEGLEWSSGGDEREGGPLLEGGRGALRDLPCTLCVDDVPACHECKSSYSFGICFRCRVAHRAGTGICG